MASFIIVSPSSPIRLLPFVGLVILVLTRASVVSTANCRQSNCQLNVKDDCQGSVNINCNLKKQRIKKINITKTSFPEHVQEIIISNVEEMWIEADAIASLASLETIELENIGTLTLLPRSLAPTNESGPISVTIKEVKSLQLHPETFADWRNSGSKIIIRDVDECHMPQKTIAPRTLIRNLKLMRITALTIDHDAIAADSAVENMFLTEVTSLIVKTGAFAANTTVQLMELEGIESLTLHTGAFARNFSIQNAVVKRVAYLLMDSGGIQADISNLTINNVFMATCEDNTFGSTIQAMSLASSHINLTKSGCVSASAGWKKLLVKNSKFDHIESFAIQGKIDQVQIKDSHIGTVDTEGFTLNVTRFTVLRSTIGDLSEKSLAVSAAEVITLKNCDVDILRKHAFSLLQLDSSANDSIRLENLHIQVMENESMQIAPGTNVVVSQLKLGVPCTCDMVLELGLPSPMHLGHGNDTKASSWFKQIECVSNTTALSLAEYHREYCPDPTTTPPPTTTTTTTTSSRRGGGLRQSGGGPPRVSKAGPDRPQGSRQTHTGSVNTWVMIGTITAAVLMLITVAALLVRRQLRRSRSIRSQPNCTEPRTSDSLHRVLLAEPDSKATASNAPDSKATAERNAPASQATAERNASDSQVTSECNAANSQATSERNASDNQVTSECNAPDSQATEHNASDSQVTSERNVPGSQATAECGELEPRANGSRQADSDSRRFQDTSHQLFLADQQTEASRRHPRSPKGSFGMSFDRDPESGRHPRSAEGSLGRSFDRHPESRRHPRSPKGSFGMSFDPDPESRRRPRSPKGSFGMSFDRDPEYQTGARGAQRPSQLQPAERLHQRHGNTTDV